jgi:dCMP deaminase
MFPNAGRPSRDQSLLAVAFEVSRRSTCSRARVGAVLAQQSRPIMTGYNGTPPGMKHCDHTCNCGTGRVGHGPTCPAEKGCTEAVHAEANAIAHAARHGVATYGATLYVTYAPCLPCAQLTVSAGIVRVVYANAYRLRDGLQLLKDAKVQVIIL